MLKDVAAAQALEGHRLWLCFDDGVEGEIDVAELVELTGVFEPLRDPGYFRQMFVDRETGTVAWPNGADLDPVVLYAAVTKQPVGFAAKPHASG
jgi:hypothetical protein